MAYFVTVSYDLFGALPGDYQAAYDALASLGLNHQLAADEGTTIALPNTTVYGKVDGASDIVVRNRVVAQINTTFRLLGLRGKVFVVVGADPAWSQSIV